MLAVGTVGVILAQFAFQQGLFFRRQPLGLLIGIGQGPEGPHTEQYAGHCFNQEQPLPAAQAAHVVEVAHDPAGQRAADHAGQRQADHEQGDDPPPAMGGKPGGQVIQYARQEPGLGGAQKEPQDVELGGGGDQHGAGREQAPGDHDAGDPDLRTDLFQDQVAWDFEKDIADKKQPGAEAERGFAEVQLVEHLQFGKADIDAVQVGCQVAETQERNQLPGDLVVERVDRIGDRSRGRCIRNGHWGVSWR